jgi:hypothetical protein
MNPDSSSTPDAAVENQRGVNSVLTLVGGKKLAVVQGAGVVYERLEAAWEAPAAFAPIALEGEQAAHVNPSAVAYIEPLGLSDTREHSRPANARVFFADGTWIDVLQGVGVANKRLLSAGTAGGLFASLVAASGARVYLNRLAVTHIAAITG